MKSLVFAHFSRTQTISGAARHAIAAYGRHFDKTVFVSTSPLSTESRNTVQQHCDQIIERDNIGYDFCGWKAGIEALGDLGGGDSVVVANDSMIGPLGAADDLFARLWSDPRDLCGLTLNWEYGRHVQSYFMRFNSATIRSGAFEGFWNSVIPLSDKQDIIERYEVGATRFMESHGHSTGALFEPPAEAAIPLRLSLAVRNAALTRPSTSWRGMRQTLHANHLNPTHFFWREILDDGIPYIKRELVRDNPTIRNLAPLFRKVERRFGVPRAELSRLALG